MITYTTPEQASEYLATRLHAGAWETTTERRLAALATAQTLIDALPFNGYLTLPTQAAAWPRTGITDHEGRHIAPTMIPPQIAAACAEWALHLLGNPSPTAPAAPIKRKRVGDLEIEYAATTVDPLPPMVRTLLTPFLRVSANSSQIIPA